MFLFCGDCCCSKRRFHIKVTGPSESGKTSFIKWVKHKQFIKDVLPTAELEIEEVVYEGMSLVFWDSRNSSEDDPTVAITRSPTLHPSTVHSMSKGGIRIDAIIYCVDSTDPGRFRLASKYLSKTLASHPTVETMMLMSTKTDNTPESIDISIVKKEMHVQSVASDRDNQSFAVSCASGHGMDEALSWLGQRLRDKQTFCERLYMACQTVPVVPDLSDTRIRP